MTMGNYEVPVPKHWLVTDRDSVAFTLVNTAVKPRRDAKFGSSVTVFPFRSRVGTPVDLDFWVSFERASLQRKGVKYLEEERLNLGDQAALCIGESHQRDGILRDTDVITLDCKSAYNLEVLFLGERSDLQPFYSFISEIRRRK